MRQYLYLGVIWLTISLMACSGSTNKVEEKSGAVTLLEQKVIAIHDEAMEKIKTVQALHKRIDQTIAKLDQEQMLDEALAKEAEDIQDLLQRADKGMDDWMRNYKAPSMSKMTNAEATSYLTQEQQKIEEVNEMVKKGIQDAEAFLAKL